MVTSYETLEVEGKFLREEWTKAIEPVVNMNADELWDIADYDQDTLKAIYDQHAIPEKDYETPFNEYANKMMWQPGYLNEASWQGKWFPCPIKKDLYHEGNKRKNEKIMEYNQWDYVRAQTLPFAGEFDHLYKPLRRNWKFTKRDPHVVQQQRENMKIVTPRVKLLPHVQEVLVQMMEDMMKKKERKIQKRQEKIDKQDKQMRELRKEKEKAKELKAEQRIKDVLENQTTQRQHDQYCNKIK